MWVTVSAGAASRPANSNKMIELLHFSHLPNIKSAPDFVFDTSLGAIHKCHSSCTERLIFAIAKDWESFSNWRHYGKAFNFKVSPSALVSVGIGGSFHQVCVAKEIDDCAISLGESLSFNFRFLEICVPINVLDESIKSQILLDY